MSEQQPRQAQAHYPPQQPYGRQPPYAQPPFTQDPPYGESRYQGQPRQPFPQGQAPGAPPRGHRSRQSWPRRHKVLTVISGIFGAFILIGAVGAATSRINRPAVTVAAVSTTAPAATRQATAMQQSTRATARPKASRKAKAVRTADPAIACDARLDASGDIYVWMLTPGVPALAQELGGEWRWNYATRTCQTSVQLMISAAPQTPGNCTHAGYVADNPGYDPNATPAKPLKIIAAEKGPAY